jgi:hypothetical protein
MHKGVYNMVIATPSPLNILLKPFKLQPKNFKLEALGRFVAHVHRDVQR